MKKVKFVIILSCFGACTANAVESSKYRDASVPLMRRQIHSIVEGYATDLNIIRKGFQESRIAADIGQKGAVESAIHFLDDLLDQEDSSRVCELLPIIDILHYNNTEESPPMIKGWMNGQVKGTLNYVADGIFSARLAWEPSRIDDETLVAMLRFYAGNPAQSVEGSWQTNHALFVLYGNKVVDLLATHALDRVGPFFKAVQEARREAGGYHGSESAEVPLVNRLTSDQLQAYEIAFRRLEELATSGVLPTLVSGAPEGPSSSPGSSAVRPTSIHSGFANARAKMTPKRVEWQSLVGMALLLCAVTLVLLRCMRLRRRR